ncbi:MAG TPA: hypothetical protein VF549_13850 [Solirubrobacteraceae bacterium]|jgi:hypothetical protein
MKLPIGTCAAAVTLLLAVDAQATTYCVASPPGCAGTAKTEANAEATALDGAARSDGQPDVVWFGGGVYADPGTWQPGGSDDLEIRGTGASTILTSSGTTDIPVVRIPDAAAVVVRDLVIRVPASFPDASSQGGSAVAAHGALLERVTLESRNVNAGGAEDFSGSTFRDGQVKEVAGGTILTAFRAKPGSVDPIAIEGSTIQANRAAEASGGITVTIRRSILRATGNSAVVDAVGGTVELENCILFSKWVPPLYATGISSFGDSLVRGDHLTILNGDGGGYAPVKAQVYADGQDDATVILTNSIARGFPAGATRQAPSADDRGDANVAIRYSNLHLGAISSSGDGTLAVEQGNIDADPQFGEGFLNFRPSAGSPSIDAGNPGSAGPAFDFAGDPRAVDGDGDGVARRDQGAYEYQPPPPPADDGSSDDVPAADPATAAPAGGGATEAPVAQPGVPGAGGAADGPAGGPQPLPGFGTAANVTIGGVRLRRGRVVARVRNFNAFAVAGTLRVGRRSAAVALGAGEAKRLRVRLSRRALRRRRVVVRLVLTVRAPSGATRTVTSRVRLRR